MNRPLLRRLTIFTLMISLMIFALPVVAQTVIMRDGSTVEGSVVSQTRDTVTIRTAAGVRTLSKSDISRIVYGQAAREVEDAARKAAAEEEARRKAAAEAAERRQQAAEGARRRAEAERQRQATEESRRQAEEDRLKAAEEAARKRAEDEQLSAAERARAEAERLAEQQRRQAEERQRQQSAQRQENLNREDHIWRRIRNAVEGIPEDQIAEAPGETAPTEIGDPYPEWVGMHPLLKSAIFPGWGHAAIGKRGTAWATGGLFWGSVAYVGQAHMAARTAQVVFNDSFFTGFALPAPDVGSGFFLQQAMVDGERRAMESAINRANQAATLVGVVYLGQLFLLYRDLHIPLATPAAQQASGGPASGFSLLYAPERISAPWFTPRDSLFGYGERFDLQFTLRL